MMRSILCFILVASTYLHVNAQRFEVFEVRDYQVQPDQRAAFAKYFEQNFLAPQNELGAVIMGCFGVQDEPDRFFWIRGFSNMKDRGAALNAFYLGEVWRDHGATAVGMLYTPGSRKFLVKPLKSFDNRFETAGLRYIHKAPEQHVKIDYFSSKLRDPEEIKAFLSNYYDMNETSSDIIAVFTGETESNSFPLFPITQDADQLIVLTQYDQESQSNDQKTRPNRKRLNEGLSDSTVIWVKTQILFPLF